MAPVAQWIQQQLKHSIFQIQFGWILLQISKDNFRRPSKMAFFQENDFAIKTPFRWCLRIQFA